jgi:hypothetical protein
MSGVSAGCVGFCVRACVRADPHAFAFQRPVVLNVHDPPRHGCHHQRLSVAVVVLEQIPPAGDHLVELRFSAFSPACHVEAVRGYHRASVWQGVYSVVGVPFLSIGYRRFLFLGRRLLCQIAQSLEDR